MEQVGITFAQFHIGMLLTWLMRKKKPAEKSGGRCSMQLDKEQTIDGPQLGPAFAETVTQDGIREDKSNC